VNGERDATTWHVDEELLAAYTDGEVGDVLAWSVEAHLVRCAACRARQGAMVDPAPLRRMWAVVDAKLDQPRPGPVERGLLALGVPEHVARLLAATPALRVSWLAAVAAALALATLASAALEHAAAPVWLLVVAPLLPLAGVAAAYGPGVDPTYELALTAPMRGLRLLLIRAAAVLTTTTLLAATASLALPGFGLRAAAWLLPSLTLTLASLALSTFIQPLRAAALPAAAWVAAVALTVHPRGWTSVLFAPAGQAACAALAVTAAAVLAARRRVLDTAQRFDTGPRFARRRLS
jgi:hypothetical protein